MSASSSIFPTGEMDTVLEHRSELLRIESLANFQHHAEQRLSELSAGPLRGDQAVPAMTT
ncbi:hypothetical protein RA280_43835 [Cupriavidus sp. CV2]|uniref:hypothetical protein n=1 Tax=Cupriavidus ulmosensis TaxID=3065913 RepID=UPI00296B2595|nr:hypothetical protein [Cupriavidus sp. CV2]MDW3688537.1 hypothetical protein [Cupriavidus sp. CV2]